MQIRIRSLASKCGFSAIFETRIAATERANPEGLNRGDRSRFHRRSGPLVAFQHGLSSVINTAMVRAGGIAPMSTVEQGGEAILHLVAGDDVADRSGLFNPACDAAARQRLRALSIELTLLPAARATSRGDPRPAMVSKRFRSRWRAGRVPPDQRWFPAASLQSDLTFTRL